MSQHGGRSFHGHRKQDKEAPKKDTEELTEDHEEEEDPFDTRIKNSGCADLHYALLKPTKDRRVYTRIIRRLECVANLRRFDKKEAQLTMALKMLMLFVGLIILGLSTGTKMRPRVNHSRKGLSGGCKPKDIKQGAFHPYSCLDYLKKGFTKCGIYKLVDSNDNSFPAYCDLQSEPGSAWTLVMSWSHSYHRLPTFISTGFKTNGPVNENSHNWNMYRLSLPRIRSLQTHSTHWRATCSYPNHDIDYRDYLRGNFKDFNIVDYLGSGQCRKVEYINIRGHIGIHLTARFWQSTSGFLHIDSSNTGCQFNPTSGSVSSEDNFGGHSASNPNFRCTKDGQSTTQWWFGGHL